MQLWLAHFFITFSDAIDWFILWDHPADDKLKLQNIHKQVDFCGDKLDK